MKIDIIMLLVAGVLTSCGVYLILEKALTRILLGFLLLGNALNILFIDLSGKPGVPSFFGFIGQKHISDPLAQAMVLTSIVISMASAAFIIALAYRSFMIIDTEDISHVSRESLDSIDLAEGARDLVEDDDHYSPAENPVVDRAYADEYDEPTGDLFEPLNLPEEWDEEVDSQQTHSNKKGRKAIFELDSPEKKQPEHIERLLLDALKSSKKPPNNPKKQKENPHE